MTALLKKIKVKVDVVVYIFGGKNMNNFVCCILNISD